MSKRLYVIAGQSNALGSPLTTALADSSLASTYSNVTIVRQWGTSTDTPFTWEEHAAEALAPRDPDPAGGNKFHGVELSMGRALDAKYPGRVYLLQFAVSASGLANHWQPDSNVLSGQATNLYAQLVAEIEEQETALGARLEGVAWIQGNNDAGVQARAEAYAANARILQRSLREDLPSRDFRFVFDQLSQYQTSTYMSTVRAQQAELAQDPAFTMLKTDSYKLTDGDHYDSASFVDLGYAFARAL